MSRAISSREGWLPTRAAMTAAQATSGGPAGAFDQAVGVKAQQGARRYAHAGYLPSRIGDDADHQPCWDISYFNGLPRAGDDWGEMTGQ
jgi:hypothetical protein